MGSTNSLSAPWTTFPRIVGSTERALSCPVKASYAVYPSEVNSLDALWGLALDRLGR